MRLKTGKSVTVPIDELKIAKYNPRVDLTQDDDEYQEIKRSIEEFGYSDFIVINKDKTVIGGHQRLKVLKDLGFTEIEVSQVDLNKTKEKALNLALNNVKGRWDSIKLSNVLNELKLESYDLSFTGFKTIEIDNLLSGNILNPERNVFEESDFNDDTDPESYDVQELNTKPQTDRAEELNQEWQVEYGDIWQLGRHLLICGDSTKVETYNKIMGDEIAEICFTSPPYADIREYKNKDVATDSSTISDFIPAIRQFARYCCVNLGLKFKNDEIVEYWDEYIEKARNCEYKLLAWNVWDKLVSGGIFNQTRMFATEHEFIFVFGEKMKNLNRTVENSEESEKRLKYLRKDKKGRYIRTVRQGDGTMKYSGKGENYSHKNLPSVIQLTPYLARNDENIAAHPAVMPESLPSVYIDAMTNENDIILEPFAGSGTTLIACEKSNRICRGIEISPEYCAVILQRFFDHTGVKPERIT